MTKKGEGWISRRGQAGAATAVELVIERQPQEPVQQVADELIEDSPYQARGPISDASVSELAQGMVATGFQGVLIVRPHADASRRRHGAFQLVYGHRRRAAWRLVCQERGEPCLLPVVVREVSDVQMLTIGAQENLQRQDLDPVEEAQIVAWAERMFFDKNQAEIGAMLGKSSDWVSTRSRIHRLPDELKEALRQRPRAIKQMLELASLAAGDLPTAQMLARELVRRNLTVEALRRRINEVQRTRLPQDADGDKLHNSRAGATAVQEITNVSLNIAPDRLLSQTSNSDKRASDVRARDITSTPHVEPVASVDGFTLLQLLVEAELTLSRISTHRDQLPHTSDTCDVIARIERALALIRQSLPAAKL